MRKAAKNYHYPLRLASDEAKAVNELCRESRVSFNKVVALCVKKALPEVREALTTHTQRITNVDPLPHKALKRLYRQADDDADSIRLFMAAQIKTIKE